MSALNTLTENASRLRMRLQETIAERTRDLQSGGAAFLDSEDKIKDIRRLLDSSSDRDKLQGMKLLVAMISKGRNVSEFFAQVVKNVASQNLEIRKLVYIYLLRYAESEPDLALLSINTFQKDLTDPNPLIRAMALRVLSGIRVPIVGSLIVLGVKKSAGDPSPYVRKAAALAIPKCYSLDVAHLPALLSIITTLLRDRSPLSIGAVTVAFNSVCPNRLDLIHQHYRRLCRVLVDIDGWGQVTLLDLLGRYARTMLSKPSDVPGEPLDPDLQLLLTSAEPLFNSRNPAVVLAVARSFYYLGPTSQISKIIQPVLSLLHVSKEVERVVLEDIIIIAKENPHLLTSHHTRFFVLSTDLPQTKCAKLQILVSVVTPDNVQTLLREFGDYVNDADDKFVAEAIEAIGYCARLIPEAIQQCLTLLMNSIKSHHDVIVSNAILVLKNLVQTQLYHLPSQGAPITTGRHDPYAIISRLAHRFDEVRHPRARACVLWLVGQYSPSSADTPTVVPGVADWAPDVLRKAAKGFNAERDVVKLQIINLAAKLFVLASSHASEHVRTITLLTRYVFSLARYDMNHDVRDRGRVVYALLVGFAPELKMATGKKGTYGYGEDDDDEVGNGGGGVVLRREQVRLVLFDGKPPPLERDRKIINENAVMGTLGIVIGKDIPSTRILPEWPSEGTDSSLRDTEDDRPPPTQISLSLPANNKIMQGIGSGSGSRSSTPIALTPTVGGTDSKAGFIDLDKFYEESSSDGEDESEEEVEEREEDEGETEEEGDAEGEGEAGEAEESDEEEVEEESDESAHERELLVHALVHSHR